MILTEDNMFSPVTIKRKSRNDLSYDCRYTTPDHRTGIGYIEGVRGRSDNKDTHRSNYKKAQHASDISHNAIEYLESKTGAEHDYKPENDFNKMGPCVRALRDNKSRQSLSLESCW